MESKCVTQRFALDDRLIAGSTDQITFVTSQISTRLRRSRQQVSNPVSLLSMAGRSATGLKNRQACALSSRLQMFQNGGPRIGFRRELHL